jgi:hypothetical protein
MADVVAAALDALGGGGLESLEQVLQVDLEARKVAEAEIDRLSRRESSTRS